MDCRLNTPQGTLCLREERAALGSVNSWRLIVCLSVVLLAGWRAPLGLSAAEQPASEPMSSRETVGPKGPDRLVTPVNQIVSPAGRQVELPRLRPQALALSPDGTILATSGKSAELIIIDPATASVRQRVALPSDKIHEPPADVVSTHILEPDKEGELSFTGLIFSPSGDRIYLANVNGSVKVFTVDKAHQVSGLFSMTLPRSGNADRENDIPSGLALSKDGTRLYVVLNLSNRLVELDAASGKLLRSWDVGFAPFDVVLGRDKAYVSNWGGRRPEAGSLTGPAGHGTRVRVDPVRHIASEGSVSVIDLAANQVRTEILTGLHASAMALSPNGRYLAVANAASDTVSVVDARTDKIVETIWAHLSPAELFGASPNALVFDPSGNTLYVCNGTQNAVAVVAFRPGKSSITGLIPVGWFPGAICFDAGRKTICVANVKGIGPGKKDPVTGKTSGNSHQYFGSVSLVPVPDKNQLKQQTATVLRNGRAPALAAARLPARAGQPPRVVPERAGEPSVIKHVVYVIKENRTYDQVLGDMAAGNGEPSLCVFGEKVTPNQHKMASEFVLLDNTYCSGILSADGHQWADTAFATDYMEKSFASFPRSYPDGMEDSDVDALAYSPAGFIWDNALAHGKTLRDYGEFAITELHWRDPSRTNTPTFTECYREFVDQTGLLSISSRPAIESLRPYIDASTVGWHMDIPDVFRAAEFIKELKQYEQKHEFPNLVIICLPNDHTSGTRAQAPTPAAQVADNDLALGRIVEALSHSSFWAETCLFAIEDDPQTGWDHVSGYRTTAYLVSPYAKRHEVVSTQYNQTSLIRTMELMLGLPPMNVMDASATPMTDCFTAEPDLTPFSAVPNQVPLDKLNPDPKKVSDALLRRDAYASARLKLDKPDQCPEDLLNRILWHAVKGSKEPYPVWAVGMTRDDD